ncbi:probable trehalase isoform X4 [Primulina huaijiensis]|uniref:probable trehalase isoform X4 n=1 Tax=Primulina huaijiensis TaxID=1492673 RepID=UPI003CC73017
MDEMELDISSMAHITGNSRTAARFRDATEARKKTINSILWNAEMGQWLDYWLSDSMHIESKENCILILGNGQEIVREYFIHKDYKIYP